jgi:NAD(P)-dependent dehydrogenase (short-subunit alcohol dehydrogenase family)
MEMATLRNKTALVTGASRGIGRATAAALSEAGAHVLVHYGRSSQEAESLVDGIRAKGGRAEAIRADLAVTDGATSLAKEVRSIGGERSDVLVCNAGVSKSATKRSPRAACPCSGARFPREGAQPVAREPRATEDMVHSPGAPRQQCTILLMSVLYGVKTLGWCNSPSPYQPA